MSFSWSSNCITTLPASMPSVSWSGVKHSAILLWYSRNVFSKVMNRVSLSGSLMDKFGFCGWPKKATFSIQKHFGQLYTFNFGNSLGKPFPVLPWLYPCAHSEVHKDYVLPIALTSNPSHLLRWIGKLIASQIFTYNISAWPDKCSF